MTMTITMTITISATRNPQLGLHFGLRNSVSYSRKQALAFGKKPNARFAVLQTAIRGCASAMLKTMQILALHSAFTRIQGTEVSGIGKNAQSCVFCSNFALAFERSVYGGPGDLSPKIRDFRGLHKGKAMRSDEDSLRRRISDNDNVNDNDNKLPTPTLTPKLFDS